MSFPKVIIDAIVITADQLSLFKWSGRSDGADQCIEPIQMLSGEYAVPLAVLSIAGISSETKSAIMSAPLMNLTCCDFKDCGTSHS